MSTKNYIHSPPLLEDQVIGERLVDTPTTAKLRKKKGERMEGKFLKGPIPWWWLEEAAILGKNALCVGISLWHHRGMQRDACFSVPMAKLGLGADSVDSVRRGVSKLEKAGLIQVTRKPGRKSIFKIEDRKALLPKERKEESGG